jgi:hypothetical protein
VTTVTIAEADDLENPVYSRRWDLSGSHLKAQEYYPDGPLIPGHTYDITATMSEYTNYATMRTQDGANIPVINGVDYSDTHNSEYVGEITIPTDLDADKVIPLVINDTDLAENPTNSLLQINPSREVYVPRHEAIIDPSTELTRGANGVMQGIGGADTFHHLRIDAASPIIGYNRHGENQALDGVCSGRPTDLCGTEGDPINITYNHVKFTYTDIGSGPQRLTIYKDSPNGIMVSSANVSIPNEYISTPTLFFQDGKYAQTITDRLCHATTMIV